MIFIGLIQPLPLAKENLDVALRNALAVSVLTVSIRPKYLPCNREHASLLLMS